MSKLSLCSLLACVKTSRTKSLLLQRPGWQSISFSVCSMLLLLTFTATACRLAFLLCSHNCPPAIKSKLPTYLFAHLNSLSSWLNIFYPTNRSLTAGLCIPKRIFFKATWTFYGYNQCLCDTWKTENPFFLRNNCFLGNMLWYYGSDHLGSSRCAIVLTYSCVAEWYREWITVEVNPGDMAGRSWRD